MPEPDELFSVNAKINSGILKPKPKTPKGTNKGPNQ